MVKYEIRFLSFLKNLQMNRHNRKIHPFISSASRPAQIIIYYYAAINMSSSEGVPLSLGELTGGGMFVQTVVVGRIVFLGSISTTNARTKNSAGEKVEGVACRGELIRDVTMYGISAGYVFWMCSGGSIYYRHVVTMLLLYCVYVGVVFAYEIHRYYHHSSNLVSNPGGNEEDTEGDTTRKLLLEEEKDNVVFLNANNTPSSHDEEDQSVELNPCMDAPVLGGYLSALDAAPPNRQPDPPGPDPPGIKQSTRVLRVIQRQQLRQQQRFMEKRKRLVTVEKNDRDPHDRPSSAQRYTPGESVIEDRPWSFRLFGNSLLRLCRHFHTALYLDIWTNPRISRLERWFMMLESPFIVLRKLVTPIPCEEEYDRSLVAYSIALSPLWACYYLSTKMEDFDPFCTKTNVSAVGAGYDEDNATAGGVCFPVVVWPCCISFAIGCVVIKYAPCEKEGEKGGAHHTAPTLHMPLRYSLPIALYGFVIAASWIDVISDQLVNVLEFIGVILRIPAPVMGMTVLAWGNSVGDYTTNGTLAQRGLADMSMAACFAGPTFNLLVGLGCGLLTQKEVLLSDEGLPIALMQSVRTGFVFLICNCLMAVFGGIWNKGVIPKMHGYIFWSMYFAYMTMSAQNLAM
mmetsp:Transcript_15341/g.36781  ORF Transcript_15341/g.36781 Transcript_15341/m.36781 type:complete len:628 (-) Transcript_15341:131-2014(-)